MADGGAFAAVKAASIYALPQAAWFLVDIVRYQRRTRTAVVDSNFKLRHYRKVRYLYSPGAAAYRGGRHLSAKTKSPGSAGGRGFLLRLGLLGWRGGVRGRVLPRISILVAFLRSFHPSPPLPLVPSL
jgi:hypothetical protein